MTIKVDSSLCVRRSSCRICDSRDLELVLPLAPTPSASDFRTEATKDLPQPYYPLDVLLCRRCGLVQLADTVDPVHLYAQSWERTSRDSPGMAEHFQRFAESMRSFKPADGQRGFAVEIGSNDGCLLRALKDEGWMIVGVDACAAAAKEASQAGIPTLHRLFNSAFVTNLCDPSSADLIIANNVLANIDDLPDVAEGIRALLKPTGVFVFETGSLADLVGSLVFDNIYHEHLSYFSVRPLIKLFADHGLELFHVERVETKGGSLRGFVQHYHGPRAHSTAAVQFLAQEEAQGLDKPATYVAMGEKLARIKGTLGDVLAGLQSEFKAIIGYGASHSVVTLLHQFDLADYLRYVVDDNPIKVNLYTPGHKLLVMPSLYIANAAYAVILPWRFADMILAKNQPYLQAGGRFIVPIPEVRIL